MGGRVGGVVDCAAPIPNRMVTFGACPNTQTNANFFALTESACCVLSLLLCLSPKAFWHSFCSQRFAVKEGEMLVRK